MNSLESQAKTHIQLDDEMEDDQDLSLLHKKYVELETAQKERSKLIEDFARTQHNNECAIDGNLKKIKEVEGVLAQARQLAQKIDSYWSEGQKNLAAQCLIELLGVLDKTSLQSKKEITK